MSSNSKDKPKIHWKQSAREKREEEIKGAHRKVVVLNDQEDVTI